MASTGRRHGRCNVRIVGCISRERRLPYGLLCNCGGDGGCVVHGPAAEKLRMFERVRAAGGFANEDPAEVAEAERTLRAFAATDKGSR
jgi:hypothetical protein